MRNLCFLFFLITTTCVAQNSELSEQDKLIIEAVADIHKQNSYTHANPLHVSQTPELIDDFVAVGYDINAEDVDGFTPLHVAILQSKPVPVIARLLHHGANVNLIDHYYGRTPLHQAIIQDNEAIVKLLIEHGANIFAIDFRGVTIMDIAIRNQNLSIIQCLQARGASLEPKVLKCKSYLHEAVEMRCLKLVRMLIGAGLNINNRDIDGNTPLHLAALYKDGLDIVEMLIDAGADVNALRYDQRSPLHLAINDIDKVQLLLDKGANINQGNGIDHGTPLHYAIREVNLDVCKLLIEKKANLSATNYLGATPLHLACQSSQCDALEIARMLLDNQADMTLRNKRGRTPLHDVAETLGYSMLNLLLDRAGNVDIKDYEHCTPLHLMISQYSECSREHVKLLIEKGADVNAQNLDGWTPLLTALANQKYGIAEILLQKGANPLIKGHGSVSSLECARKALSQENKREMALLNLIEEKAKIFQEL